MRKKSKLSIQIPKRRTAHTKAWKVEKPLAAISPNVKRPIKRSYTKSPLPFKSSHIYSPSPKKGTIKPRRTLFSPRKRNINSYDETAKRNSAIKMQLIRDYEDSHDLIQEQIQNEYNLPSSKSKDISLTTELDIAADTYNIDDVNEETQNIAVDPESPLTEELIKLAPQVMNELSKSDFGLDVIMLQFFKSVAANKFPLSNISYLLWCEVVKWFQCETTTKMRYFENTKTFWKLGWRLFGGRFIHFMSGYKNQGDLTRNPRHEFSPETSEINFAVPDLNILRYFDPYNVKGERNPGIYDDLIATLSDNLNCKSSCLTFDGKKIKQGLTETSGDVDLLGFESKETLQSRKAQLKLQKDEINEISDKLTNYSGNIDTIPDDLKEVVESLLFQLLQRLSTDIFEIRDIKDKKEYCKAKLIEKGGNADWRKGKYVYAISAVIAYIHDIDTFLRNANNTTRVLVDCITDIKGSQNMENEHVNLLQCSNYESLDSTPPEKAIENSRYLQQRSDEWFKIRASAKVTGSTLYAAIGCDGLNKEKDHFEKVFCGVEKEPTDSTKQAMRHGTENEINAVATIVGVILPALYPNLKFCEEGCVIIALDDGSKFMVVSPDGSLREDKSLESTKIAIEIKCPVNKVHAHFPPRYLLQCLSEIEALQVDTLLYISWTKEETTVFQIQRDSELFGEALNIALRLYDGVNVKKPTKLEYDQKEFRDKVTQKSKKIELVGIFPSKFSGQCDNKLSQRQLQVSTLISVFQEIVSLIETNYELRRQRASEAMVFLVADLDRSWEKENLRCAPVSWFPRGYSLSTETIRQIVEEIINRCHIRGIHLPCQSFDGQWHGLVTRSHDGHPLTIYQLQKDIWKEVEQMKKVDLVSLIENINTEVIKVDDRDKVDSENTGNGIILTNGGKSLPQLPKRMSNFVTLDQKEDGNPKVTMADVLPDKVKNLNGLDDALLSLTSVNDNFEIEALAVNIEDNHWVEELEKFQNDESDELNEENETTPNTEEQVGISQKSQSQKEKKSSESIILDGKDMTCLLSLLKTTKNCNKKGKWDNVSPESLMDFFTSVEKLNTFLDVELRTVVRYMKKTKVCNIKESSTKYIKVKELGKLLNLNVAGFEKKVTNRKAKLKSPKSLSALASGHISKFSKRTLNVIYAEYIWRTRYESWIASIQDITVEGKRHSWFYKPEFSTQRQQYEVKCIDSTHLLTRTRTKICKGGIEGFTNESWMKVARSGKTLLTPVMVQEIVDPMSVSMAATHISQTVENVMISNGDVECASLCNDIRNWWQAEDSPGIPAKDRLSMRENLRKRLLTYIDFSVFPPKTMYIGGWPAQLWEALLASMDAKTWLYSFCHGGTYNVRAFSSMIGETFFSEVTMNDRRGQGTISCKEFGQYIGSCIEQVQVRLDPERTFSYSTKRSTVYNLVEETELDDVTHTHTHCRICTDMKQLPSNIVVNDHKFDSDNRKRLVGRKREATISRERNALQKGTLGVRWEKARSNESKMLPTVKMGIDL